jgi:GntR family transcriptional regulator, transcriptional repressor for pyruvate dehydrogenase complex
MPLSSLRRGSLVELATTQLRDEVARGTWPVGTRIPAEAELAGRLGVGRSTVREAVRALVHAGMLEARQGAGTFVLARAATEPEWGTLLRRAAVLEVYEVREGLERQAALLAAQRRTPGDIERIEAALARRQRARQQGDGEAFIAADLEFHQAVVVAAHNDLLEAMYASFLTVLKDALTALIDDAEPAGGMEGPNDAHVALAAAIRAGDAAAAAEATDANVVVTARALREQAGS